MLDLQDLSGVFAEGFGHHPEEPRDAVEANLRT